MVTNMSHSLFFFFSEEFDFLDRAKSLVVTSGLNLTYTQISKVNKQIQDFGLGLGVIFVHRINESDVAQNMMVNFYNLILFAQFL